MAYSNSYDNPIVIDDDVVIIHQQPAVDDNSDVMIIGDNGMNFNTNDIQDSILRAEYIMHDNTLIRLTEVFFRIQDGLKEKRDLYEENKDIPLLESQYSLLIKTGIQELNIRYIDNV